MVRRPWITGALIETTLELRASSLRDVKPRMRGLFTQGRVAVSASLFHNGLLGAERRKTGWMCAEAGVIQAPGGNRLFRARGLLIRRNISGGDLAFFTTWCPAGTRTQTLVSIESHRWAIEDSFETAKNELGLHHNEKRSWLGWHSHVSLVMLAFAMMAVIRYRANNATPQKRLRMPAIRF